MTKRKIVIFTHIPKVAGTSLLERLIHANYAPEEIRQFRGIRDLVVRRTGHKVLIGHNPFGMGDFIPSECSSFTMFRDPVARAISHFTSSGNPRSTPRKRATMTRRCCTAPSGSRTSLIELDTSVGIPEVRG